MRQKYRFWEGKGSWRLKMHCIEIGGREHSLCHLELELIETTIVLRD